MTRYLPIALTLLSSTLSSAAPAAKKPALGELVMDGHDAGHVTYADKCSNGANSDEANRKKYIAAMVADKKSKLAISLADTEKKFVADVEVEAVLGDWEQTFHLRDGCGEHYGANNQEPSAEKSRGHRKSIVTEARSAYPDSATLPAQLRRIFHWRGKPAEERLAQWDHQGPS